MGRAWRRGVIPEWELVLIGGRVLSQAFTAAFWKVPWHQAQVAWCLFFSCVETHVSLTVVLFLSSTMFSTVYTFPLVLYKSEWRLPWRPEAAMPACSRLPLGCGRGWLAAPSGVEVVGLGPHIRAPPGISFPVGAWEQLKSRPAQQVGAGGWALGRSPTPRRVNRRRGRILGLRRGREGPVNPLAPGLSPPPLFPLTPEAWVVGECSGEWAATAEPEGTPRPPLAPLPSLTASRGPVDFPARGCLEPTSPWLVQFLRVTGEAVALANVTPNSPCSQVSG